MQEATQSMMVDATPAMHKITIGYNIARLQEASGGCFGGGDDQLSTYMYTSNISFPFWSPITPAPVVMNKSTRKDQGLMQGVGRGVVALLTSPIRVKSITHELKGHHRCEPVSHGCEKLRCVLCSLPPTPLPPSPTPCLR